jgi:molybdopterin-guanine dinucleotide biosynthesis protein A
MGGGDKPLLDVGGSSMLVRVIAALRPDAAAIAISANGDPARFAAFALPVLPDGTCGGKGRLPDCSAAWTGPPTRTPAPC